MIRALRSTDIAGLNGLPPPDWNFNYEDFVSEFFATDYFYAFVLIQADEIIGTGNVFVKGRIGWLANIIVSEKYRGKGLGFEMTAFLVDFLKSKGCATQLLIATELGESVYKKIGFKKTSEYRCFESDSDKELAPANAIRGLEYSDLEKVRKMDKAIIGEDRDHLINRYYKTGLGYFNDDKKLLGFYLPDFGRGPVVAENSEAGIELLKVKHSKKGQKTLLPIENHVGISFLKDYGINEGLSCSRMIFGKENDWNPQGIYSYAGGHCG